MGHTSPFKHLSYEDKTIIVESHFIFHYCKELLIQSVYFGIMSLVGLIACMIELVTNFQKLGRCIQGKFLLYKLIGIVAYLMHPWIYCPFKGGGDLTLEGYKMNWNFIQSSTWMCVE
jgi:hypothetical protein